MLADLLHTGGDLRAMFGRDSDDSLLQEQLVMGVAANTHAAAGSVAWQQQQENDQQQLQHAPGGAPMAGAGQEGAVGFGMGMRAGRRVVGVPRLAKIAEVAVRRRMMDDIDLAEKVGVGAGGGAAGRGAGGGDPAVCWGRAVKQGGRVFGRLGRGVAEALVLAGAGGLTVGWLRSSWGSQTVSCAALAAIRVTLKPWSAGACPPGG